MTDLLTPEEVRALAARHPVDIDVPRLCRDYLTLWDRYQELLDTDSGYDPRQKYCPPLGRPPQTAYELSAQDTDAETVTVPPQVMKMGETLEETEDLFFAELGKATRQLEGESAPEISENSGNEPHKTMRLTEFAGPPLACPFCGAVQMEGQYICNCAETGAYLRGDHLPSLLATQTDDLVSLLDRRLGALVQLLASWKAEILEAIKGERDGP